MDTNIISFEEEKQRRKKQIKGPKYDLKITIAGGAAIALSALIATGIGIAILQEENHEENITPTSYQSFYENTKEYTVDKKTLQEFGKFEEQLNIYKTLSENPEGLTYIQKQELNAAKQYIESNYETLESVYLYQAKSKVAIAYGLPKEKISNIKTNKTGIYTIVTNNISGTDVPTISNEPKAYLGKLTGNNSNVVIPSELKKAISDIEALQSIRYGSENFPYEKVFEIYNNFLKFLSLELESDEKGNISLSDENYKPSAEDIVEYYSPIYENLKNKKNANFGNLKRSQEARLQEVMSKMYGSLLDVIEDKTNKLEKFDSDKARDYRDYLIYVLNPVSFKGSIVSTDDVFPLLYYMNEQLDEELSKTTPLVNEQSTDEYSK